MKKEVIEGLGITAICEESPVGDHKANGFIERGIKIVQGQVRTLRLALEERLGQRISEDSKLVPWMVIHASG